MRVITSLIIATLTMSTFATAPFAAAADCLPFEPVKVTLTGSLVSRTFPGPPNFNSTEEGDRAEEVIILVLNEPICINANSNDALNPLDSSNIREVQLVFSTPPGPEFMERSVAVYGSLFAAHTGHHHVPILLTVISVHAA